MVLLMNVEQGRLSKNSIGYQTFVDNTEKYGQATDSRITIAQVAPFTHGYRKPQWLILDISEHTKEVL